MEAPKKDPVFDLVMPHSDDSASMLFSQILKISSEMKEHPMTIALDYMRLAAGPGKLSPDDFMRLRLYDKKFYSGADMRQFVGEKVYHDICFGVNYRHDWLGMLRNKVASISYLGFYGLPTIPVKAVYAPYAKAENALTLPDKEALEAYLLRPDIYPIFGKPLENQNSLGSIALQSAEPGMRSVTTSGGKQIAVEDLAREIDKEFPAGYLLQEMALPHKDIAALTGKRLTTVRFLTMLTESGALIFRVCLKIPTGQNTADNYWRPGNLLAQIDIESGKITRVTSGAGVDIVEHTVHPDTKAPLVGFIHPQWQEMKELALKGARLMRALSLIGWDIACTDKGPVIVEMNEYPDSFLMQISDRRGLLDDTFRQFIEFQKKNAVAYFALNQKKKKAKKSR